MTIVTVQEAKTHLSRLLAAVEAGESIVIRRGPKVVAKLVPFNDADLPARRFGVAAGLCPAPPLDFFEPLSADEAAEWESS